MIYLFVLDDSLTSQRITTRTEQLTKSCEPLQKMRVRLVACKIDLRPPSPFYVLDSNFVLFEPYIRFHIFTCI